MPRAASNGFTSSRRSVLYIPTSPSPSASPSPSQSPVCGISLAARRKFPPLLPADGGSGGSIGSCGSLMMDGSLPSTPDRAPLFRSKPHSTRHCSQPPLVPTSVSSSSSSSSSTSCFLPPFSPRFSAIHAAASLSADLSCAAALSHLSKASSDQSRSSTRAQGRDAVPSATLVDEAKPFGASQSSNLEPGH